MPRLPASNNKDPRFPTSNIKDIQKKVTKLLPSYYVTIKAPNMSNLFIFGSSIVEVRSYESKHMIRNKDSLITTVNATTKKQNNSNPFILVTLTESIYSCESKRVTTKNNDNKHDKTFTHIRAIRY